MATLAVTEITVIENKKRTHRTEEIPSVLCFFGIQNAIQEGLFTNIAVRFVRIFLKFVRRCCMIKMLLS